MDAFEAQKRELFGPIFLEAGAGLLDCQGFEFGVALLLYHLSRLGTFGLDPKHIKAILDDQEKKTAGQLIHMLKKHCRITKDVEGVLEAALKARNRLIHRVLIDNVETLVGKDSRKELLKEIKRLRIAVRKGDETLRPFIMYLGKELDGWDSKAFEEEVRRQLS